MTKLDFDNIALALGAARITVEGINGNTHACDASADEVALALADSRGFDRARFLALAGASHIDEVA